MRNYDIILWGLGFIIFGLIVVLGPNGFTENFATNRTSIGISILMAGLLAITLDIVTMRKVSRDISHQLSEGLNEIKFNSAGFLDVSSTAKYEEIYAACRKSKTINIINTWSPNLDSILTEAKPRILKKQCTLHIYLLHPHGKFAEHRSESLGKSKQYVQGLIEGNEREISAFVQELSPTLNDAEIAKHVSLHYYDKLPSCAIYQVDGKAWMSFYWMNTPSERTFNLVADCAGENLASRHVVDQIAAISAASDKENEVERLLSAQKLDPVAAEFN